MGWELNTSRTGYVVGVVLCEAGTYNQEQNQMEQQKKKKTYGQLLSVANKFSSGYCRF